MNQTATAGFLFVDSGKILDVGNETHEAALHNHGVDKDIYRLMNEGGVRFQQSGNKTWLDFSGDVHDPSGIVDLINKNKLPKSDTYWIDSGGSNFNGNITHDQLLDAKTWKRLKFTKEHAFIEASNPYHDESGRFTGPEAVGATVHRKKLEALFQKIQDTGGFTYKMTSGSEPKKGFAVSIHPERSQMIESKNLRLDHLTKYMMKNYQLLKRPTNYLGAWHDPDSGKIWLDVTTVRSDPGMANHIGAKANQIAMFDLAKKKSIPIKGGARTGIAASLTPPGRTLARPPAKISAPGQTLARPVSQIQPELYLTDDNSIEGFVKLYTALTGRVPTMQEIHAAQMDYDVLYQKGPYGT